MLMLLVYLCKIKRGAIEWNPEILNLLIVNFELRSIPNMKLKLTCTFESVINKSTILELLLKLEKM